MIEILGKLGFCALLALGAESLFLGVLLLIAKTVQGPFPARCFLQPRWEEIGSIAVVLTVSFMLVWVIGTW
jgi:hypothetical protein